MKIPHIFDVSRSMHAKLTMLVMLTVLVIFSIVTYIISNYTRKTVLEGSEENAMNRMEITNQYINSVLMGVEVAVENIPEVDYNQKNPDQLYQLVQNLLEMNPNIIGSAIAFEPNYYPEQGIQFSPYAYRHLDGTIKTKQLGTEDYDYHSMDWYQIPKLLKKSYWSEPYYDTGGGEQMMTTYSRPLYDAKGNIFAILTADISLNWLTELMKKNDIDMNKKWYHNEEDSTEVTVERDYLYTHAYTFIIGKGGSYITHPLTERILNETYFTYCLDLPDSTDLYIGYEMIDGHSGMGFTTRDGVKYTICYAPIARTGWSIATVIPSQVIFQKANTSVFLIILAMLSGMIVLIFVCNTAMKHMTRPLVRFAKSADEISNGNLDALLPDIKTKDEMKILQNSFQKMQTSLKNQMEELQKTTASKTAIESELKVASDIQMSMLPKIFPAYPDRDDIDIFGQLTPAKAVGGDLFDFFIRDEKLFFCIGDVSGKGVPAALVMAVTRAQFRTVSTHESQPERIVTRLNDTMCQANDSNMFVTLFVGVLDLPTGRMRYCNAGHDAPLLIGFEVSILPCDSNLPVGVLDKWKFSSQETTIPPMTTIFLYTDGLTEAENINHDLFGEERILKEAEKNLHQTNTPNGIISNMSSAVRKFVDGADQSDDLTMLTIKYTKKQRDVRYQNKLVLSNDIEEIPQLTEFVNKACEAVGLDESKVMSITLALEEAVANVMNYAYPAGKKGLINIETAANDTRLKFIITDSGVPFDPTVVAEADTTLSAEERSIGGLGIFLVRNLMDSVNYERVAGQNVLTLRVKI